MGLCLVDYNGEESLVIRKATVKNGALKDWQKGLPKLLDKILAFSGGTEVDKVGIEMIVWYGKRKGVLALAHLAGACFGIIQGYAGQYGTVQFFLPKEVKATSAKYPAPKGYDEHQHDALSICRLLAADS